QLSPSRSILFLLPRRPPRSTLFPFTPLFRSKVCFSDLARLGLVRECWFSRHLSFASADRSQGRGAFYSVRLFIQQLCKEPGKPLDRKSTRLNSSHVKISYAVFCLKKKKKKK